MTNINTNLKSKPFLLKPSGKDYIWGGNRLKKDFSKDFDIEPLAETWECSTHPDGPSIVNSGQHKGKTLSQVLKENPEYIGTHPHTKDELPILIKFIDAEKDLSVQVHPDDNYAFKNENGSLGKSEMWYVIDAEEGASLVYGFYNDVKKENIRKSIENGTIEKYLQKIPVKKDDVFYIEAGTVHAIGKGILLAEIQENSNLTYRLYDYNRKDKNGKTRELHIDKALDVANLKSSKTPKQPMRVLKYKRSYATELLCRCKYFQTERMILNTEKHREIFSFQTDSNSFQVLLCIDGSGTVFEDEGINIPFFKGDCIFVPANSINMKIHGKAQLLKISC